MPSYVLTETTLELLKNLASINPQTTFKAGTAQRVCNSERNFIADVELPHPLPRDCAIYELPRLLGVISTCKGESLPTIEFGDSALVVEHEHGKVTIPYAHDAVMVKPPTQQYHLAKPIASFDLPQALWDKIKRIAATLQTQTIHIVTTKSGTLELRLVNEKDKSSGSAKYNMPNTQIQSAQDGVWGIKFNALELLPGDYTVEIGEIASTASTASSATMFGAFFRLNDPVKRVTYLTSGHVVPKDR